jgi:hypothetical protein
MWRGVMANFKTGDKVRLLKTTTWTNGKYGTVVIPEGHILEILHTSESLYGYFYFSTQLDGKTYEGFSVPGAYIEPVESDGPRTCTCDIDVLMRSGCKCGGS